MVLNLHWEYLEWTDGQREAILNTYNRTSNTVQEDIDIIKKWFAQQPHLPALPEVITDNVIEFFLIFNKFRMELVKQRIDFYLSIRPHVPEVFQMDNFAKIRGVIHYVCFKKLTANNERILCTKFKSKDATNFNPYEFLSYVFYVAEMRLRYDRALADIYVLDFQNTSFEHTIKFTPTFIKTTFMIIDKVFASRFNGLYLINAPKFVDGLLNLIKSVMKEKLKSRIKSYPDASILFELLPKSDVPKDFGGDGETLQELSDILAKQCSTSDPLLEAIKNNPVKEKLRPGKPLDITFYGTEGTFRQLQID